MKSELLIAIVDDNNETRKRIISRLDELFQAKGITINVMSFPNGIDYRESLTSYSYDITFMDIEMPGDDGIAIAKSLTQDKKTGRLVYVSNREDRVFDCFATHPFGFVRKSRFEEDCPKVIDAILKALYKEQKNTLVLKTTEGTMSFQLDEIIYLETTGRKTSLHVQGFSKPVIFNSPLSDFAENLEDKGFIATYKGFLVNVIYIDKISSDGILMKNKEILPVSRRKVTELKQAFMENMNRNMAMIF